MTAGIRTNWVQAIRRAVQNRSGEAPRAPARVPPSPPSPPAPPEETPSEEPPPAARAEATSSSDDHSEYFSIVDDEEEEEEDGVDSPSRNLPPSPPLNRTAISRWAGSRHALVTAYNRLVAISLPRSRRGSNRCNVTPPAKLGRKCARATLSRGKEDVDDVGHLPAAGIANAALPNGAVSL